MYINMLISDRNQIYIFIPDFSVLNINGLLSEKGNSLKFQRVYFEIKYINFSI